MAKPTNTNVHNTSTHDEIRERLKSKNYSIIKMIEHDGIALSLVYHPEGDYTKLPYMFSRKDILFGVGEIESMLSEGNPFVWWLVTATKNVVECVENFNDYVDLSKYNIGIDKPLSFIKDTFTNKALRSARSPASVRLDQHLVAFYNYLKTPTSLSATDIMNNIQDHLQIIPDLEDLDHQIYEITQSKLGRKVLVDSEITISEDKIIRRCKAAVNEQYKAGRLLRLVKNPFDDNEWLGVYAAYHEYYRIPSRYTKVITETFMGVNIKLFELNEWMNHIYRFNLDAVIIASSTITVFNDMPNLQNSNVFDHIFNNSGYLNMFTSAMYNTAISIYQKLPVRDLKIANTKKRKLILQYVALGLLAKAKVDAGETSPSILTSTAEAWRWLLVVDDINDIPWENGQGKEQYLVEIKGILDILGRGYPYYVDKHADFTTYPRPLQVFVDKLFSQLK